MKLPTIAKIRIPILQALAVGEAVGLYYFYGQPKFFQFVVASVLGVMFIVPLLFLDFMRRIQVKYNNLLPIQVGFVWLSNSLKHKETGFAIVWAFLLIVGIISILNRLYIAFRKHPQTSGGRA